jgi:hypothetical protein
LAASVFWTPTLLTKTAVTFRKSLQFSKKWKPLTRLPGSISAKDRISQKQEFAQVLRQESTYHKYLYVVETCNDGARILLSRPTRSHGLDFEVRVEGFKSVTRKSKSNRPSHKDLTHDLRSKVRARPDLKDELFAAICDIYDCAEPQEILTNHPRLLELTAGLPVDKILRIIKWLFIEQDMTYWLGTGRNMFMCSIERAFGLKTHLFVEDMPKERCTHRKWAPREILQRLNRSRGGSGRRECAVCAYAKGYGVGLGQPVPSTGQSECPHGHTAPSAMLEKLPSSKARLGGHKCVICAYHEGRRAASLIRGS